MKVLQIFTFYPSYLEEFYRQRPHLSSATHSTILETLMEDGFGALHFYAEDLPRDEFTVDRVIANDEVSQNAWAREHGCHTNLSVERLVAKQVNTIRPDVLLVIDPVRFDSKFIRSLSVRPRLIIGWRAATVPKGVDWSEFDAMLSNHEPSLQLAQKLGAAESIRFQPGFPQFIANKLSAEKKEIDVCFTGSLSPEHKRRIGLLSAVSKSLLLSERGFSLAYYADSRPDLPTGVNMHCVGSRWGIEMYRTLSNARINLNADPDFADPKSANMRLFEATGAGGFLLTEHKEHISDYFQPGVEVETFKNSPEALEKIDYYLTHPDKREKIAQCGRAACLERFSRTLAANRLSDILRSLHPSNKLARQIRRGLTLFRS